MRALWRRFFPGQPATGRAAFTRATERFVELQSYPDCPLIPEEAWAVYREGQRAEDDLTLRACAAALQRHNDLLHRAMMAVW